MKNNNQYLEKINESVGGQATDKRKTNIYYLRSIAENTGSENLDGQRTDNYYLRLIALNMEDMDVKELLQTIAELRGEVEELEELLANDIHLFSCCKDIVQTDDALDLFAYCKYNGEVEGNTVHFYAIDNNVPSSITVTTNTNILSYYHSDEATITVTVLNEDENPISNYDVVVKNGSTVLGTVKTNSDGIAEYDYSAQGLGDVTLTIECGELSETISIEDCTYYRLNTEIESQVLSISDFPVNFTAEFDVVVPKTDIYKYGYLCVGSDANNNMFVGAKGTDRKYGISIRHNGQTTILSEETGRYITINRFEFSYDDGELTYSGTDTGIIVLDYEYTARDYISIDLDTDTNLRYLKIKPL